ncbi:hypothetical protein XC93_25075 [Klebsiella variicola]|nr:hypothetical protein [Klebsiella variicola]
MRLRITVKNSQPYYTAFFVLAVLHQCGNDLAIRTRQFMHELVLKELKRTHFLDQIFIQSHVVTAFRRNLPIRSGDLALRHKR